MSQQINLFDPAFRKQRNLFSFLAILETLAVIIAGSLLFYGYAVYQVDQLGKQLEESAKRYTAERERLARYAAEFSPQDSGQALQEKVQGLEIQIANQSALIETINSGALGNTTGYSEYMRAFSRQVVQGLWLTGFKVSGDAAQISLNGAVLNPGLLAAYIQRLSQESVMRGKTFATLQMRQTNSADQGVTPHYVEFALHSGPGGEAIR